MYRVLSYVCLAGHDPGGKSRVGLLIASVRDIRRPPPDVSSRGNVVENIGCSVIQP
ncbi:hypothetical protein PSAB6_50255 [Paraburkholderia sabiae]|nr:hypothetical protein PSAB6_50255 [Paraburkholderia sabiae]